MTDIYAFGENWDIPAPLRTKLEAVVANWVRNNPTTGTPSTDRGVLPDGTDLNTLTAPASNGVWGLSATGNYQNSPFVGAGHINVSGSKPSTRQTIVRQGYPEVWERTSNSSTVFNPWSGVNVIQLPAGSDLDALRSNGEYTVRNATDASTMSGWPSSAPRLGARISVRASTTGLVYQQMQTYGATPQLLIRSTQATTPVPYPFSPWVDVTAKGITESKVREIAAAVGAGAPPAVNAGLANALLVQDFTRRRPIVKTNGKPAISLRVDHGLKNFKATILPALRRLNLKAAICLNAGDWARPENEGVTKEEVNGWVTEGVIEVWNHSLNHTPPPADPVELERQIKGGLDQLRLDLPAATIDGYMPPGGSGDTTGFDGGRSPETWWSTTPARMILQYHAVASGYINNSQYRVLDGEVRQGQLHYTVDTMALDDIQAKAQAAYTPVRGVQFMVHPSLLGSSGNITSADYVAFLEWVAGERDAGRAVVLTPYELLRADATPEPVSATTTANVPERDITPAVGVTTGKFYLSRSGPLVTLQADGVVAAVDDGMSYKTFNSLVPSGFYPTRWVDFRTAPRSGTEPSNTVRVDANGRVVFYGYTGQVIRGVWTWRTSQAVPSTLPGVAV